MKQTLAAILLFFLSTTAAHAQSKPNLVKAEMIADVSAIKAGETFHVGILLTMQPGWHVYWMNPGDSGRATTVKFRLPDGFKAGPLKFPVPIKFNQPGNIVGYGYEKQLLLTVEVTAPKELHVGSKVSLPADVVWLCCKESCIPGKAKLNLDLPVGAESKPADAATFKEWADRFPLDKDPAIKSSAIEVDAAAGTFTHKIDWNAAPKNVELYPGKDDSVEVSNIDIKTDNNQTRATLTARLWPGQKKAESENLPTLLVYTDQKGVRHGVNLSIPLTGLKEAPGK